MQKRSQSVTLLKMCALKEEMLVDFGEEAENDLNEGKYRTTCILRQPVCMLV